MMLFTATTITGVEASLRTKIRDVVSPKVQLGTVNIVVKAMIEAIAQNLVRSVPNVAERITFKAVRKSNGSNDKQDQSRSRSNKGKKVP